MAKSEMKFEKKMSRKEVIPFLCDTMKAYLGEPGWIITSSNVLKVKVKGKDDGEEGKVTFTITWKDEKGKALKKEKKKDKKKDKKEKTEKKEKDKKEKKKRGRPKKEKLEEKKAEWKPTKEDLVKGKATYEKDGWRGLIKIYGSRRGKVIKDLVIPKVPVEKKKRGRPKKEKKEKTEIKEKKKRGRPKKEKEETVKKEWKPAKEDIEKGKVAYEKDGWIGLIKIYGTRRGKVIKELIVAKEQKVKKKEISKKEKKEKKKAKKKMKKEKKSEEKAEITERVEVHKWGGAIQNLTAGDQIVSKSGTKRVVLSAKGDVVRVKTIKIDGVETEEAMSREKIMILGQNIEEIIPEYKKKLKKEKKEKAKKEKKEKKKAEKMVKPKKDKKEKKKAEKQS